MWRILLLFILTMSGISGFSQEADEKATTQEEIFYNGNSEFKINGLYLLLGFPELTYEHVLNDESGIGISVAFSIEDVVDINFMAIPYYRVYFGKKPASGFFVEGNGALYFVDHREYFYYDSYSSQKTTNEVGAGLGLAVGGKFMTKSLWIFEVFGGGGRNFVSSDEIGGVYPRFGLTVGRRF